MNDTPQRDERVGMVRGDRPCVNCGYNLVGQPVVRESVYGMIMVRCPECAELAALQEYPALARSARRIAAMLTGVWVILLIGLWFGSGMAFMGIAIGASDLASTKLSRIIDEDYAAWHEEVSAAAAVAADTDTDSDTEADTNTDADPDPDADADVGAIVGTNVIIDVDGMIPPQPVMVGPGDQIILNPTINTTFTRFWSQYDSSQLRANRIDHLDFNVVWFWLPMMLIAMLFGMIWSLAILKGGLWRFLVIGVIFAMPVAIVLTRIAIWEAATNFFWSNGAAEAILGPVVAPITLVLLVVATAVGLWMGRPLCRLIIRFALPPRIGRWLSFLWEIDDRPVP